MGGPAEIKLPADCHAGIIGGMKQVIHIPYSVEFEDGWFLSHCPVFKSNTEGKTTAEAVSNLVEAVECQIEGLIEDGDFEKTMKSAGYHVTADDFINGAVSLFS